ncbi:MAG: hypothetical protein JJV98_17805 [Desulfosarcina sp.]|nr:hypothetical protein [Desulfobacterales bacterium]
MRRHGLITVLLLTVSFLTGHHAVAGQPLEKAFLGLPWGADIREQDGFQMLHGKDKLRFYTKPGTVRTVKNIRIKQVIYGTYGYRFFAAYLIIDSPEAFADLRNYMESRYGFPKTSWEVAGDLTTHRWRYHDIKMKLKSAEGGQRMKLAFYYTPIARQVNEAMVDRQQKGVRFLPIERDKKPEALPLLEF